MFQGNQLGTGQVELPLLGHMGEGFCKMFLAEREFANGPNFGILSAEMSAKASGIFCCVGVLQA